MQIFTEQSKMQIDGKTPDGYSFFNFKIKQELGRANEFSFHMAKKELVETPDEALFSLSEKLLGKKIEFFLKTWRRDEKDEPAGEYLEFEGIICGASAVRSNMGARQEIVVKAYSADFLLNDSPHCYCYEKQNLQAIVADVMKDFGNIKLENQPTVKRDIDYVVRMNETSYEFLRRLASRYGQWLYPDNGRRLVFGSLPKETPIRLHPRTDILKHEFHLQMKHMQFSHAAHNYTEYDENITEGAGFADGAVKHGMTDIAYRASKDKFRNKTYQDLLGSSAEDNMDEVSDSAKAQALGRKAMMTVSEARSNRADLKLGSVITIKNALEDYPGEFSFVEQDNLVIYRIEHYATPGGGYENCFLAMPATATVPPCDDVDQYPHAVAQRAVVKDNKDDARLGRVRVQFHWQKQQDESLTTPWIRIAQPHGGEGKGFYFIPEIGEEVMVGFENGNAEKPYVIGTLYHGKAKAPEGWYNEQDDIKAIRTRSGHTLEFHDKEGEEMIKIYDNQKDNYILTFSTKDKLIKLESANNIEFHAKNDIIMKAGNNIDVKAEKDINREAGKNVSEKAGDNITLNAGKNISETAGDDYSIKVGQNMTTRVEKDITTSAGKELSVSVKDDISIKGNNNANIMVSKEFDFKAQKVELRSDKDFHQTVGKEYSLETNSMKQTADNKIQIIAGAKLEQKSKSGMDIDGGTKMDIKARNVNIN